ncbi:hypothetical protein RA307_30980, partial [Xanthobacteraceae bacterium Astr-EGSB]|nr:hypothetical protein [Xanthobacteraceae bacterium Astr-EGSB]
MTRDEHRILLGTVLVLVMLRGAFALTGSSLSGRLSVPPSYDDVTYFVDALRRLRLLYDQGFFALLMDLLQQTTHSPLSFFLAFFGFGLLGVREVAPYVMNACVLSLWVWMMLRLAGAPLADAIVIAAILILLPYNDWIITFFHPDALAGLIVALACSMVLMRDPFAMGVRSLMVCGLTAGLGLI